MTPVGGCAYLCAWSMLCEAHRTKNIIPFMNASCCRLRITYFIVSYLISIYQVFMFRLKHQYPLDKIVSSPDQNDLICVPIGSSHA